MHPARRMPYLVDRAVVIRPAQFRRAKEIAAVVFNQAANYIGPGDAAERCDGRKARQQVTLFQSARRTHADAVVALFILPVVSANSKNELPGCITPSSEVDGVESAPDVQAEYRVSFDEASQLLPQLSDAALGNDQGIHRDPRIRRRLVQPVFLPERNYRKPATSQGQSRLALGASGWAGDACRSCSRSHTRLNSLAQSCRRSRKSLSPVAVGRNLCERK